MTRPEQLESRLLTLAGMKLEWLALGATIAAAAALRLSWLDLMEFKGDEANACLLALHALGYSEPGVGRFFPTAGLVSSVGVPNPPLFVYLVALPLAVIRSPIAVVVVIASANVLAIWFTFVAGRRCFGRTVGLGAAALLALSPWGIVFSRKIWAQDLLPLATSLYIVQLHGLLVERRRHAGFWLIVITAAAIQLHFSAVILAVVTAVALARSRQIGSRWTAFGLALGVLLYAPYLVYHAGAMFHSAHHHLAYSGPGALGRLRMASGYMLGIVGGGSMKFLLGRGSAVGSLLSLVLGLVAPLGLAAAARTGDPDQRRLARLFCLWYGLPLLVLTLLEIRPYIHYFIVLLPLPYIAIAFVVAQIHRWRPPAAVAALGFTLAAFLVVDSQFFRTIIRDGGAPGDYGVAYRYEHEAAQRMLRAGAGHSVVIEPDPVRPRSTLRTYRFLIWNASLADTRPQPGQPRSRFALSESFHSGSASSRGQAPSANRRVTRLGPLVLTRLPPTPARRAG